MSIDAPFDDEIGELFSAYADGEASADEHERVHALLAESAAARAELASIQAVRALVRDLPEVDVPEGFIDGLVAGSRAQADMGTQVDGVSAEVVSIERGRRRRGPRWTYAIASVGVAAAAVVVLAGITPVTDRIAPPVQAFAARHDAMASGQAAAPTPASGPDELGFTEMDDAQLDAAGAPVAMAGFRRVHGFAGHDDTMHLMFSDGTTMVSVYEQPGAVDWGAMPATGAAMDVGGARAVEMRMAADDVVVLDRGSVVYTIVAETDRDELMAVVRAMPAGDRSVGDRAVDAVHTFVASFGAEG